MGLKRVLGAMLVLLLSAAGARAAESPTEGVWNTHAFRFQNGQSLGTLRQHYITLGSPSNPAVLVLHGTAGMARDMLSPAFGGQLFGPGQPLDAARYYIIIPDAIGAGQSSKPSDGLRMSFPAYDYADMVQAQHQLLTEHLHVNHLALVIGNSMGGMETWAWGEAYPDFMDALVPLASQPTAVAGRNWISRRLAIEMIRSDPAWNGGDYKAEPPGFTLAMTYFGLMTSGGSQNLWATAPTWAAADELVTTRLSRPAAGDANDVIYQLNAAKTFDPAPRLQTIKARVLAINAADDERNPPELGVLQSEIPSITGARYYLIPTSPQSRGHGTTANAALWGAQLAAFLAGK